MAISGIIKVPVSIRPSSQTLCTITECEETVQSKHGVKVGPGVRDPGPQDPGLPSKFKSETPGPPSKFKSGTPGPPYQL